MQDHITPPIRRQLASSVGISEQYLYQCLTGRRDMNPGEARRIETETNGVLKRQMLCQKSWRNIWPELVPNSEQKQPPALDCQAMGAMAGQGA